MPKPYRHGKEKQIVGLFCPFPQDMVCSPQYAALSAKAVKLLVDLGGQYNSKNNGDLCAAWKVMKHKGWKSEDTLNEAKKELIEAEFIIEMRKGHLPNTCSLYALTWIPLDPLPAKHDFGPAGFERGAWRRKNPMPKRKRKRRAVEPKIDCPTSPVVEAKAA